MLISQASTSVCTYTLIYHCRATSSWSRKVSDPIVQLPELTADVVNEQEAGHDWTEYAPQLQEEPLSTLQMGACTSMFASTIVASRNASAGLNAPSNILITMRTS